MNIKKTRCQDLFALLVTKKIDVAPIEANWRNLACAPIPADMAKQLADDLKEPQNYIVRIRSLQLAPFTYAISHMLIFL